MKTILDEIVAHKREEIAARASAVPIAQWREQAQRGPAPPNFREALKQARIGLIAEVKRQSPSAGAIRTPFDPPAIARAYQDAGAQAVSVLMDHRYFGGGEEDFRAVRSAVSLPMLYKEFVVDAWQVWHAAALGASAVLLIAGVLDLIPLRALIAEARAARLAALVEVHDAAQLALAAEAGADLVGINNRDLRTFDVSLETTLSVMQGAPDGCLLVSESGIRSADDVVRLCRAGVDAVLVGEHLLRRPDPGRAVCDLMGTSWTSS